MESAERLRAAISRAVEHARALSRLAHLPAVSIAVVAKPFLARASVSRSCRNVFTRAALDRQPFRSLCRRTRLRVERPDAARADVAEQHRGTGLDAVGGACDGTGVERRRTAHRDRRTHRRDTNADRCAGNPFAHLADRRIALAARCSEW